MKPTLIKEKQLKSGDILLCYSSMTVGKSEELKNGYSHVAIKTLNNGIIESANSGVKRTEIKDLLEDYGHIAVLRNNELWSANRLLRLDEFTQNQLGSTFNSIGMHKVPSRKEKLTIEIMEKIEKYFEGGLTIPPYEKSTYFCSELIVSAFIHVGIIAESASIQLSPEILSPEDIGRDKIFGFFVGYIISEDSYIVPENDIFQTSI